MKFAAFLCTVFVTFTITNGQTPPGGAPTFACRVNGNPASNDLTITYTRAANDVNVHMYVVGAADPACSATAVLATADNLVITVTGLDETATAAKCNLNLDGPTGALTGNVELYLTQSATNLLQDGDFKATLTAAMCNFGSTDQTINSGALDVTGVLAAIAVSPATETVTLTLVDDGANAADVTDCDLGDMQKLKLTLTLPSLSGAMGLHPVSCTSKKQAGANADDTIALMVSSCTVDSPVVTTANMGFTPDAALASATASVTVMTEPFKCFRFSGLGTVLFECSVEFCTSDLAGTKCAGDTCANKGNPLRARRAVTGNSTNSVTASVTINVGESRSPSASSTNLECSGGFLHQTTFIVTVTILAVLLVLSMGATIYVAKKSRGVGSNPPPYLAKGADNPAF